MLNLDIGLGMLAFWYGINHGMRNFHSIYKKNYCWLLIDVQERRCVAAFGVGLGYVVVALKTQIELANAIGPSFSSIIWVYLCVFVLWLQKCKYLWAMLLLIPLFPLLLFQLDTFVHLLHLRQFLWHISFSSLFCFSLLSKFISQFLKKFILLSKPTIYMKTIFETKYIQFFYLNVFQRILGLKVIQCRQTQVVSKQFCSIVVSSTRTIHLWMQ